MSTSTRRWLTWGIAGLVAGAALGLFIGWWLWPLRYADASPAYLSRSNRDEYILMIAEAFQVDGNLAGARARLSALDAAEPAAPAVDLAQRLREAGDGDHAAKLLTDLAAAIRADSRKP